MINKIIFILILFSIVSCAEIHGKEEPVSEFLLEFLGSERAEVISKSVRVRPLIVVSEQRGGAPVLLEAGPYYIQKTFSYLNRENYEAIRKIALDIDVYKNQRQYLLADRRTAESKMTYSLCMFEPEYAFEFEYKNKKDYFFISKDCGMLAHSFNGDFLSDFIDKGSKDYVEKTINRLFHP